MDTINKQNNTEDYMREDTKKERFVPTKERAWIVLEDGHKVTYKIYQKILKRVIRVFTKKPIYKIQETVYFVMRDKHPA